MAVAPEISTRRLTPFSTMRPRVRLLKERREKYQQQQRAEKVEAALANRQCDDHFRWLDLLSDSFAVHCGHRQ